MIYLLDTHVFIWAVLNIKKLSANSRSIISNRSNEVCVSAVSFWEISLKAGRKIFLFDNIDIMEFPQYARDMDLTIIDLNEKESISFNKLPQKENHKDPFDRMLIWQAITGSMTLISNDGSFEQYKKDGLKLIW